MSEELIIKNTSGIKINTPLFKKIARFLLTEILKEDGYSLGIFFVKPKKIAEINEKFLQHKGSTDVISFNYLEFEDKTEEYVAAGKKKLYGEIYVCPQVALEQYKKFRATPCEELLRYVVHGILHIKGYDDLTPAARKKMRIAEGRVLKQIKLGFNLDELMVHNL